VKPQYLEILNPKDFESAFQAAVKGLAEAVLVWVSGPLFLLTEQRLQHSR
jgi:hypothetical protein